MTEQITVNDVKQEIDDLVQEFNEQSKDVYYSESKSESTLLEIGQRLLAISSNVTEKEFTQFKSDTAKRLNFEKSTLDKVVKISRNREIRANKEKLPTGWATLYLLCQIEPDEFKKFMDESGINTSTTRTDLRQMVDKFKGKKANDPNNKKEKLSIRQIDSPSIEPKKLDEFVPLLNKFLCEHGWERIIPKENKKQEQDKE